MLLLKSLVFYLIWNTKFNFDPKKKLKRWFSVEKLIKLIIPVILLYFNENLVKSSSTHKQLEMITLRFIKILNQFNSISIFKSNILKFIRCKPNNVYRCHNPKEIRLLRRLHQGLSHLREHKFKNSFQDCLNPLCFSGNEIETSTHYLLHCPSIQTKEWTKSKELIIAFLNLVIKTLLRQKFFHLEITLFVILLIPSF